MVSSFTEGWDTESLLRLTTSEDDIQKKDRGQREKAKTGAAAATAPARQPIPGLRDHRPPDWSAITTRVHYREPSSDSHNSSVFTPVLFPLFCHTNKTCMSRLLTDPSTLLAQQLRGPRRNRLLNLLPKTFLHHHHSLLQSPNCGTCRASGRQQPLETSPGSSNSLTKRLPPETEAQNPFPLFPLRTSNSTKGATIQSLTPPAVA